MKCGLRSSDWIEKAGRLAHDADGWGARIRTWEWRNQNPLPYHLATPHWPDDPPSLKLRRASYKAPQGAKQDWPEDHILARLMHRNVRQGASCRFFLGVDARRLRRQRASVSRNGV